MGGIGVASGRMRRAKRDDRFLAWLRETVPWSTRNSDMVVEVEEAVC